MKERIIELCGGEDRGDFIYIKRWGIWMRFWKHQRTELYLLSIHNRLDEPFVFTPKNRVSIFNVLFRIVDSENKVLITFDNDTEQELFSLFVASKKLL